MRIGPFAVLYLFEYLSLGWGINGTTITWIQSAVLRRYLHLGWHRRARHGPTLGQPPPSVEKHASLDGVSGVDGMYQALVALKLRTRFTMFHMSPGQDNCHHDTFHL